jgi:hypothetical protein
MHYARIKRTGSTDDPRLKGWGQKRDHPMYRRWQKLLKREQLCEEWKDFWQFVKDIGTPVDAIKLRKLDETKLYGKTNFEWAKTPTKEEIVKYQKNYREQNAREIKSTIFKRKYGISLEEYEKLFEQQNGCCAICKTPERVRHRNNGKGDIRMMAIDHCHKSNKVRGLLCLDCNTGLGSFKDNPKIISNAVEYLKKHQFT